MAGSSSLSGINPLGYLGVRPVTPVPQVFYKRAPDTNDIKNFTLGTVWLDTESEDVYMLVNVDSGIATWNFLGGATDAVDSITTPDGTVVLPSNHNIDFLNGTGMNVTGSGHSITFNSAGAGFSWQVVTASTQQMEVQKGYISNAGGGVTYTLPATATVGDAVAVTSINAGGFVIEYSTGQSIRMGNLVSTVTTGSLASTSIGDSLTIICTVENTDFIVLSSIGNINIT